ncbi:hypothetical protein TRFO_16316 [Tritrichomonas foetus]|uniref:Uncharacterized protein n=1 Tax=Tritrichomonas foetus TaxID=1144522 RepID=A0A1J4KQ77_9EUKA|nr:hypothetical protein TRFO_16316 [Tritrichomonas foetus]|eukprot:OHT13457.1 hypothetical protein TRFO_16316 [Tritrichomonas foetus]
MNEVLSKIIFYDKYDEFRETIFDPNLELLMVNNFNISPGVSNCYWNNMKFEKFAESSFLKMCTYLLNYVQCIQSSNNNNNSSQNNFTMKKNVKSILYSVLHISVAYNYIFNTSKWKPLVDNLLEMGIPKISPIFMKISDTLNKNTVLSNFKSYLDDIVDSGNNVILHNTLPIFILTHLLRFIFNHQKSFFVPFIKGIKQKLEMSNNTEQSIVLLHLIRVFLTIFPDQSGKAMILNLTDPLKLYLAKPSPVSDIASQLGMELVREGAYRGSTYFTVLSTIIADNSAFESAVPIYFDQTTPIVANFLYSKTSRFHSIPSCLISFVDFFIIDTLKSNQVVSIDDATKIIQKLSFTKKGIEKIRKMINLSDDIISKNLNKTKNNSDREKNKNTKVKNDLNDSVKNGKNNHKNKTSIKIYLSDSDSFDDSKSNERTLNSLNNEIIGGNEHIIDENSEESDEKIVDASNLMPPIFRFVPNRVNLSFPVSDKLLTPIFNNEKSVFSTPLYPTIKSKLIDPVRAKASIYENDDTALIFQPVLLAGSDLLITNMLQSLVVAFSETPEVLSKVVYTWYVVPVDKKAPNEIASFLGRIDPIYHRFVENIFVVASKLIPKSNEDSIATSNQGNNDSTNSNIDNLNAVEFKTILERNPSNTASHSVYNNHTWFSDPSPNNMFQFSLHHFLMFGRSAQMINVWKCEILLENNQNVVVPWVSSVHVGEEFSKIVTNNPPPNLKCSSIVSGVEYKAQSENGTINNQFIEKKMKLKSISIWNIEGERKLKPTDPFVVGEWTKDSLSFKKGETRASYASKIMTKIVTEIEFKVKSGKVFSIMIDQKTYGPAKQFSISKMDDPRDRNEQLQIRLATFYSPMQ